ncbi:hypothetical protein [Rubrivirga marina]|uniref:hypothetical protein n=1 Tax=Rubrivirga marina TaxID=1196024 RepID=UPI001179C13E|nr:hypothetical protein [Rubrivirga marina]
MRGLAPEPSPFGDRLGPYPIVAALLAEQGMDEGVPVLREQLHQQDDEGRLVVAYGKTTHRPLSTTGIVTECHARGFRPADWPHDGPCFTSSWIASSEVPDHLPLEDEEGQAMGVAEAILGAEAASPIGGLLGPTNYAGECTSIQDSSVLEGSLGNTICTGAWVAGGLAGMSANVMSSIATGALGLEVFPGLGGSTVGDFLPGHTWMIGTGAEMRYEACNAALNETSITLSKCALSVADPFSGVGDTMCQTGDIAIRFIADNVDQCDGGSARCEATGKQTCAMEGNCSTCEVDVNSSQPASCQCL